MSTSDRRHVHDDHVVEGTRQCVDCLTYRVVTWTKSVNAPRCPTHTRLRRSWAQSKWRAVKAGRTFPGYTPRVLTAQRLLLTAGQIDEIDALIGAVAAAATEIGSKREAVQLAVFADLTSSRKRLTEVLEGLRSALAGDPMTDGQRVRP